MRITIVGGGKVGYTIAENLANEKTTKEQILMCFDAYEAKHWKVLFD